MSFTSPIVVLLPLSLHVFHILNCFNILISLASPSPYDKRTLKRKRERERKENNNPEWTLSSFFSKLEKQNIVGKLSQPTYLISL